MIKGKDEWRVMQALILAAGFGKRLRPLTDKIPKALVEVNGTPLLLNALNHLSKYKIDEVIIVTGHMKDKIVNRIGFNYSNMKIIYVDNPIYDKTNNVYSLYLAKNYIHDDLILLECDLFYNQKLIDTIMQGQADCNILVSPYDQKTMNGTVIKVDSENNAQALIIKRDQGQGFDYTNMMKTVNIYTFKKDFAIRQFFPAVELYIKTESINSYYELVLGSLIYYGNSNIKVVPIDATEWCEIDDMEDLKRAQMLFGGTK